MAQRGEITSPRAPNYKEGVPGSKQTPKTGMGDQVLDKSKQEEPIKREGPLRGLRAPYKLCDF